MSEATKNPAAVELGHLGGLKGGPARAHTLSPERRRAIGREGAKARWERPAAELTYASSGRILFYQHVAKVVAELQRKRRRLLHELNVLTRQIEAIQFLLRTNCDPEDVEEA